jgi:hypothetical protein
MGTGIWLNPDNLEYVEVRRHEDSITDPKDQKALDLSPESRKVINKFSRANKGFETAVRLAALVEGMIRIRGDANDNQVSIEFYKGDGGKLKSVKHALEALQFFILDTDEHPYGSDMFKKRMKDQLTRLLTNAMKLRVVRIYDKDDVKSDSTIVSPNEFLRRMDKGKLLREKTDEVEDPRSVAGALTAECVQETFRLVEDGRKEHERDLLFEDKHVSYSVSKHKQFLNEEKLSRVWQMAKKEGFVWGIVTAYRGENDEATNKKLMNQLKQDVRDAGYGFWELDGRWVETDEQGEKADVGERSLFIAAPKGTDGEEMRQFIMDMTQKYDQDAGIYKSDPEADSDIMLYQHKSERDGERVVDEDHFSIGKFNPNKISDAYSKIDGSGRTFVFESVVDYNAGSFMGAMAKKAYDRKYGLL